MQVTDILLKLIPFTHKEDSGVVFTFNLSFGDWIVTTIEIFLISIFLWTSIKLWISYKKDLKSTNLLCDETQLLDKNGFDYYNDFKNKLQVDKKIAHLWGEFDESLIVKENGKYENSLDADYFFNRGSLASHVGSKYYSAIPGILLGIGLLGTFFALYVALIELKLDGEHLKESIRVFIGMVGVKFTASVWGIFLSVTFTFFEKTLEGKLARKIHNLQENIDSIFKRQTAEQNLFKIALESEQQTRAMNSLAETLTQKISENFNPILSTMNNNLEQMPHHISKAIGDTLSAPLEQLKNSAQNAAESQSNSLESIVNTFIDKLDSTAGDQAQGIQTMMSETTRQLTDLLKGIRDVTLSQNVMQKEREEKMQELFHRAMTSFETQMQQVQEVFGSVSQEASSSMKEMYSQQQKVLSDERASIVEHGQSISTQMQSLITSIAEQSGNRDEKLQEMMKMIQEQHTSLFTQNREFASELENSMAQIMNNIVNKVTEVQTMINTTASKLENVPSMLDSFESSSDNLRGFGDTAKEASLALNGAVEELRNVQSSINEQLGHVKDHTQSLKEISSSTQTVSQSSEETAKELQNVYKKLITENTDNLDQLGESMSKWLSKYDSQVRSTMQDSLSKVQSSLATFAQTLTSSMGALEDAIENINTKVQS